jgi:hypothetical protein
VRQAAAIVPIDGHPSGAKPSSCLGEPFCERRDVVPFVKVGVALKVMKALPVTAKAVKFGSVETFEFTK